MELSHLVHLARHIIHASHREVFDSWLAEVVGRVDQIAPKPKTPEPDIDDFRDLSAFADYIAPHRGLPLPPDILDTTEPFRAEGAEARAVEAANAIRLTPNRYLRTEAEIAVLAADSGEQP